MNPRKHLQVNATDNVTTVLDDQTNSEQLAGGAPVEHGVPFGHKVALVDIPKGAPVIKYGVAVGYALMPIPKGAHVHVHNCE